MLNDAKIQVLYKVPIDFLPQNLTGYISDIFSLVIDRGSFRWLTVGTRVYDGHFLANRVSRVTFVELTDALVRFPELPLEIVAAQSFDGSDVYVDSGQSNLIQFAEDVVEMDEDGNELQRSRPVSIRIPPPVMGASNWHFNGADQ